MASGQDSCGLALEGLYAKLHKLGLQFLFHESYRVASLFGLVCLDC